MKRLIAAIAIAMAFMLSTTALADETIVITDGTNSELSSKDSVSIGIIYTEPEPEEKTENTEEAESGNSSNEAHEEETDVPVEPVETVDGYLVPLLQLQELDMSITIYSQSVLAELKLA
ncbi:hypothetical protein B5F10_02370 [Anaerotruncus colihominis]|uniref:Uncharacterized protein n=1 Tax=Anaerotruncus colihominis TaxID=169435 RepID=A0A1Y4N9M0_9FIRM|nr:hypothetical protein [Anaerotruncus colihominis]OUP70662.1 hypothetical protein B5F11_04250 [Anaerotruncus colihominis]OUP76002.1 hypothetical protein B5F10_02370 [Anaerotruncus colihominis]